MKSDEKPPESEVQDENRTPAPPDAANTDSIAEVADIPDDVTPEVIEHFNHIIERFKQEVSQARKQSAESLEKYQRAMADFDNFRKRVAREKAEYFDNGVRHALEKLLPCLDNFERALSAVPDKDDTLYRGIEMIYKQLSAALLDLGAQEIPALGQPFDPALHNALAHEKDGEHGENTVIEEMRKGYMFKDKVLRPSMVKVAN